LRRIDGALAIGTLNREFYRAYGVPDARIFWVPYAVDNARFGAESQRWRSSRPALRESLGLPADVPVLLYAGKLIERKRPLDLLDAYARLAADHPAAIVFLGEGAERGRLEAAAERYGLSRVVITGFVNQQEISRYYAAADLLALPSSHEPWGLVLNEGMCFGLPLVASDAVGAAPDLVRGGDNGFIYPVGDVAALAAALRRLLADPALRARMGARSREIVAGFSYDADIEGIVTALNHTVRRPGTTVAS
jgi:glycosyltransferase involved in cell wall biosynthesis